MSGRLAARGGGALVEEKREMRDELPEMRGEVQGLKALPPEEHAVSRVSGAEAGLLVRLAVRVEGWLGKLT